MTLSCPEGIYRKLQRLFFKPSGRANVQFVATIKKKVLTRYTSCDISSCSICTDGGPSLTESDFGDRLLVDFCFLSENWMELELKSFVQGR